MVYRVTLQNHKQLNKLKYALWGILFSDEKVYFLVCN